MSDAEVLDALTWQSRMAFANLRNAGEINGHPDYVWARRADIDLLLVEVAVTVGIESDLSAARFTLEEINRLICDDRVDPIAFKDAVQSILIAYHTEGTIK